MAKSKNQDTKEPKKKSSAEKNGHNNGTIELQKPLYNLSKSFYEDEIKRYQFELVRLQYWVRERNQRIVIIFEGRDAAGKGGTIKRIVEPLNPRGVKLVALGKPSDVERSQWPCSK